MTISDRAMLASVRITQWTARKLDKRVTAEVNESHGAGADAGRYNKALLSKGALAKVAAIASAARTLHYERTLPWSDDGNRVLPATGYLEFASKMKALRADFDSAVAEFVGGYPAFVADARIKLNGLFDAADYPSAGDIARRFGFDVVLLPMPDARDFRVDVGDAESAAIRADIEARTAETIKAGMADLASRIAKTVGAMAETLGESRTNKAGETTSAIFRDSLVGNVRDLCALLPGLNITGDSRIAEFAARMESELLRHDAADLRVDPYARADTAKAAAAILADVSAYMA